MSTLPFRHRFRQAARPAAGAALMAASLLAIGALTAPAQEGGFTPRFTADGKLILPEAALWREWPYIGAPLTPNALNDGAAPFPEFHSVYIDPPAGRIGGKRAGSATGRCWRRNW